MWGGGGRPCILDFLYLLAQGFAIDELRLPSFPAGQITTVLSDEREVRAVTNHEPFDHAIPPRLRKRN